MTKQQTLTYGSVCSGIEAATQAWRPLGWKPAFFSEIEKFPRAVLAHHYPDVPLHGDFTTIGADEYGSIDLLVGGTPCQSFSIAGLRGGLDDDRGNLALEFLKLAQRTRPRWLVWENVPGVLSSNGGRDFGAILGGMVELGYGFAYRVLDAQYVRVDGYSRAVPQRRRRVFVVGYLGDWRRAAAVLFERESLSGNPAPRRETGQGIAAGTLRSTDGGSDVDHGRGGHLVPAVANPLTARMHKGVNTTMDEGQTMVAHTLKAKGFDASEDGTGRGTPIVPVSFNGRQDPIDYGPVSGPLDQTSPQGNCIAFSSKDYGADAIEGVSPTLRAGGHTTSHENAGVPPAIAFTTEQTPKYNDDCALTLTKQSPTGGGQPQAVEFAQNQRDEVRTMDVAGALAAEPGAKQQTYLAQPYAVRRLTPVECERLQGFPEIREKVTITVCPFIDQPRPDASAGTKSLKSQKSALSAAGDASQQNAKYAEEHSGTSHLAHVPPALVHVLINYERKAVEIRRAGKLIWSANTAENPSASPLSMPLGDFVRLVAHTITTAVNETRNGKGASQRNTKGSTHLQSGNVCANVSGQEIAALVADAGRFTTELKNLSTSTTSQSGPGSPICASTLTTSCCCAVAAIGSCIPGEILTARSFVVSLETVRGYTQIPWRGKPADQCPDGPRYKALGNSMAVNCMRWIGQRIQMVNDIE